MTPLEQLAQHPTLALVTFLGALGTPLATYLAIVKLNASARLKHAEAETLRALAQAEWTKGLQGQIDLLNAARARDQQTAAEWKRIALDAKREATASSERTEWLERKLAEANKQGLQAIEELKTKTMGGTYGRSNRSGSGAAGDDVDRRDRRSLPGADHRPDAVGVGAVEQVARREAQRAAETRPGPGRDDGRALGRAGRDQAVQADRLSDPGARQALQRDRAGQDPRAGGRK